MSDTPPGDSAPRRLAAALSDELCMRYELRARRDRPVIAIAGESGSGKSVTAITLATTLTDAGIAATVLHQDDYFHRPPATNHAHRRRDLGSVGPQEVDLERLRAQVAAFREARDGVVAPRVDYSGDRFVVERRDFSAAAVLIVDGTYVLAHVPADVRVFLEATAADSLERRRARNRDIDDAFVDRVLAIEHPIIATQRSLADIVIDRDFAIVRAER